MNAAQLSRWRAVGGDVVGLTPYGVPTTIAENVGPPAARLMAASPDLFKALLRLRDWCAGGDIPADLLDAANAALAKAEGR